jgi:hypothetical protein
MHDGVVQISTGTDYLTWRVAEGEARASDKG